MNDVSVRLFSRVHFVPIRSDVEYAILNTEPTRSSVADFLKVGDDGEALTSGGDGKHSSGDSDQLAGVDTDFLSLTDDISVRLLLHIHFLRNRYDVDYAFVLNKQATKSSVTDILKVDGDS